MNKWKSIFAVGLLLLLVSVGFAECQASSTVKIHRDEYGVPHIYANTVDGLYYGWGYAAAQDRLYQLEMLKRIYWGKVSEIYGPDYLPLEYFWVNEYPRREAIMEQYENLAPKYKRMFDAYTDGINAWVDEVLADPENKMPYEYHQLGFKPEHFDAGDIVATIMANLGIFMDPNNELWHVELYAYLQEKYGDQADDYFDDMVWGYDPSSYTTIQEEDLNGKTYNYSINEKNQMAEINLDGLKGLAKAYPKKADIIRDMALLMGQEVPKRVAQGNVESMSYSLAVSAEKSATGKPWLMGGPQVDWWVPGQLHEVGLHGAGIDMLGVAMIGAPYAMFGASKDAAFTCTAGADNIADIFEEKLNPENPLQYWYKGEWRDMVVHTQEFKVKGQETIVKDFYRSVHGPIVAQVDTDGDGKNDIAYAKAVATNDSYLDAMGAYTELSFASTVEEFLHAGDLMSPILNFVWANNKGDIGFYHGGKFPIRAEGIDYRFPTPGTGEYDWTGFVANEDKPKVINPKSGVIVNWNNKPAPGWGNGDMSSIFGWAGWSVDNHSHNLIRLVKERLPIDRKDIEDIIHLIADAELPAIAMKPHLLDALTDVTDPRLVEARELLAEWNNQRDDVDRDGTYDQVGITIFYEWWNTVNKNTFSDELEPYWDGLYRYGGLLYNYGGYSFFKRTVLGDETAVPVKMDYYNGKGWKNVFVDSLEESLDHLTEKYGTADMNKWIKDTKTMPFLTMLLCGGPSTMGEVPDVEYMDRGSQNHIVELTSPWVTGKNVVPPGQSGFINKDGEYDPHFADQVELYDTYTYKDMLLKKGDVLLNLESTTFLKYEPRD